jgi:hypothetical protein
MRNQVPHQPPQQQTIPDMAQNHSPIKLQNVPTPPGAESGFAVDIDTLKDAAAKLKNEYDRMREATRPALGSLLDNVRKATNGVVPDSGVGALGDYPAAQGLAKTVSDAFNVIGRCVQGFAIDELANMVHACADLYTKAERDIVHKVAAARKVDATVSVQTWLDPAGSVRLPPGSVEVNVPGSPTPFDIPSNAADPLYSSPIRQPDDAASWSGDYGDLCAIVESMRPQALWDTAVAYQQLAHEVNGIAVACSRIARRLSAAWGGKAAQAAMNSMRGLHDRQNMVVAAAMQIADAAGWHGDKQSIWKTVILELKMAQQAGFDVSDKAAQDLMRQIQEQTLQTNNAFPGTLYQIDLKSAHG